MKNRETPTYRNIIRRINKNLKESCLERGVLCTDEGRIWFDFDSEDTGRSLYVSFEPEKTNPDHNLQSSVETRGVVSPAYIFPDIPEGKYERMVIAVNLIYGENFGEIFSFETNGNRITNYNPFGSICKRYTERLNKLRDPKEAIDLAFEALTS